MRIGIDARELTGRRTGVGRYLSGLLNEWATADYARRHEFVLYAHGPLGAALDARRFPTRLVKGDGGAVWEQIKLPKAAIKDHLDVFFAPAYTAPFLGRIPLVVSIHDVSFFAHPEWFAPREGMRRRLFTRQAARRASAVITISDFSRSEIVERLSVPDSRIRVIPPGISQHAQKAGTGLPAVDAPAGPPHVLFVGSIFRRRHVPDLIRAFAPIARAHENASLDIVGDNRSFPPEDVQRLIEIEGLEGRARWRRYVDESELAAMYRAARAFVFLSEYEGLGLTPLEALAYGIPPVLLDTPVARESCAAAALYVRAGAIGETTEALARALFDEELRRRLFAAAPAALAKYNWAGAASETMAVIESA
jgi:glycosyltransferase involved in cell wall biosynthesis